MIELALTEIEIALRKEESPSENVQWAIERINRLQQESEQCPHWVSSRNLKGDFRDQNIGKFYCNKCQHTERENNAI